LRLKLEVKKVWKNFKSEEEQEKYTKNWVKTGEGCALCAQGERVYWNPMFGIWEHDKQHQLADAVICTRVNKILIA